MVFTYWVLVFFCAARGFCASKQLFDYQPVNRVGRVEPIISVDNCTRERRGIVLNDQANSLQMVG